MDDWKEAALSSRHMHNRVHRSGRNHGGKSKRNRPFDVRKTFGSYVCKCALWEKMGTTVTGDNSEQPATLELYRLTPNREGIIGELDLPGALKATVVLAASRGSLHTIITQLDTGNREGNTVIEEEVKVTGNDINLQAQHEPNRFQIFEKNSFRVPKF